MNCCCGTFSECIWSNVFDVENTMVRTRYDPKIKCAQAAAHAQLQLVSECKAHSGLNERDSMSKIMEKNRSRRTFITVTFCLENISWCPRRRPMTTTHKNLRIQTHRNTVPKRKYGHASSGTKHTTLMNERTPVSKGDLHRHGAADCASPNITTLLTLCTRGWPQQRK